VALGATSLLRLTAGDAVTVVGTMAEELDEVIVVLEAF